MTVWHQRRNCAGCCLQNVGYVVCCPERCRAPEKTFAISDIDIVFLRSDPSLDATARPWAANPGLMFGRLTRNFGPIVVNDPPV
jgi:hypothetical protein